MMRRYIILAAAMLIAACTPQTAKYTGTYTGKNLDHISFHFF